MKLLLMKLCPHVEIVIIFYGRLCRIIPPEIIHPTFKWLIYIRGLIRKTLMPSVNCICDQARPLLDPLRVVDGYIIMNAATFHIKHRRPSMEAKIYGNPPVLACICKRSVDGLAIANCDITWRTYHRNCLRNSIGFPFL